MRRLESVFRQALVLCDSGAVTRAALSMRGDTLIVSGLTVGAGSLASGAPRMALPLPGRVALLAVGKCALPQARVVAEMLGERLTAGLIVAPAAGAEPQGCELIVSTHPLPSAASERAARRAVALARATRPDELLLCLISGGASSLLELPAPGLTLADVAATAQKLFAAGAGIAEVNAVRKALSEVKGGRLAAAAGGPVATLVLSDVPDDRVELVGSGPTVSDRADPGEALRVVERLGLAKELPQKVLAHLWAQAGQGRPRVTGTSVVLAGPALLAAAAADRARAAGLEVLLLERLPRHRESDDVAALAEALLSSVDALRERRPACLVAAREPTVRVTGDGFGGRSQHLALLVARDLPSDAAFLACGSDGVDGLTDAAGASVDGTSWSRALASGLDPAGALARFDSGTLHEELGTAVRTGPTGVNFSDLQLLAVD